MLTLQDHLAQVEARKAVLGMVTTPAMTEALRNKGDSRTEQKRLLLSAIAERKELAGPNK
jgi:hypothetical protein